MPKSLNKKKPIIAEDSEGNKFLLLPQIGINKGYDHKGYDWFNLTKMAWNSCCCFSSKETAIKAYSNYKLYNKKIIR